MKLQTKQSLWGKINQTDTYLKKISKLSGFYVDSF